jgi:putative SOS response-associated peptidase YedK
VRDAIRVSRKRLLRLMREHALLSPHRAGVGATIKVTFGGAHGRARFTPWPVTAEVALLSNGSATVENTRAPLNAGPCAVLTFDGYTIVALSHTVGLQDRAMYYANGLDPRAFDLIVVKSPHTECHMYDAWVTKNFNVDAPGSTSANLPCLGHTICAQPMFRDSFERRRCLVPMDAFYEWSGERPPKQPWAVARRDGQEMLVAGLWDGWRAPDGSILRSFALITTGANETLRPIHHRMPVIIDATEVEIWLGDDADAAAALMRPAPDDVLRAWPVSRAVNDVRRDGPELLEPVA